MAEPKATARHKKMADSKKEKYEELKHKVSVDEANIQKKKEDFKAKSKDLTKEQKADAKAVLKQDIKVLKESIAKTKAEMKDLKKEIKADEAKAKEAEKEQ